MYMCMYGEVTVHNAIVYICCPVFAYMFVFPHLGDIVSIIIIILHMKYSTLYAVAIVGRTLSL